LKNFGKEEMVCGGFVLEMVLINAKAGGNKTIIKVLPPQINRPKESLIKNF